MTLPAALVQEYLRQREALMAQFPELIEDMQALSDTLAGITEAPDVIAKFIRDAREDEGRADALANMLKEMGERKARFAHRAERRRQAAQALMAACELRKIELPDFTASIRTVPPRVEITDETALPDSVCTITRTPDKKAIKAALGLGAAILGAHLTNGGETISIRTT